MGRIKNINRGEFFAREYKDGFVVAFKNVGDNSGSYADSIYEYVVNNQEQVLFATDIVNALNCPINISESLYVYCKGNSISGFGIIAHNRENGRIEVEYNSEKVLTIRDRSFGRKHLLACILVIIGFLACIVYNYYFPGEIYIDEPEIVEQDDSLSKNLDIKLRSDDSESKIDEEELLLGGGGTFDFVEMEDSVSVVDVDSSKQQSVQIDIDSTEVVLFEDEPIKTTEESEEMITTVGNIARSVTQQRIVPKDIAIKEHENSNIKERTSSFEHNKKQAQENEERARRSKASKEANNYVRMADQAYSDYADSFNESKGIVALMHYQKALYLNKEYSLFSVSEKEKIEQKINVLERELK